MQTSTLLEAIQSVYVCTVTVAVGVDAEPDEDLVADVNQAEDVIVSQWREFSASEKHEIRQSVNEVLRPLGCETSLVVIRRANSIAMLFICFTLSAVMGLRDDWRSGQLRDVVEKLFTLLSRTTRKFYIKRLVWPLTDFERCLRYFGTQGKLTTYTIITPTQALRYLTEVTVTILAAVSADAILCECGPGFGSPFNTSATAEASDFKFSMLLP